MSLQEYVNRINSSIKITCAKYIEHDIYHNFYQEATDEELSTFKSLDAPAFHNREFTINPHLLLEIILNYIRNETIFYSKAKHKQEALHENN